MQNKISCVIHTYNSEKYLEQCLESVKWCDEIVIVDMYSDDKTLEIAKKYNCKIYMHENIGFADPARIFGLSKCTNNWILALDSDEVIMPKLRDELLDIVKNNAYDVIKISFRNFFFGREIIGSGWGYKDQVIARFFKKEFLTYTNEVHNFVNIDRNAKIGKIVDSEKSIIHFNYDSVSQFISKLNRYTDFEVSSTKYNYKNNPVRKIIYHFFRETIGRFIYKKGYKDGWLGLYLALGMAFYRASSIAKSNLPDTSIVIKMYKNYKVD